MPVLSAPETLQTVVDLLNTFEAKAGPATGSSADKASILTRLWTLILQSTQKQQEDLLKPLPPPRLLALVDGSAQHDPRTSYVAAGCLAGLISSPAWLAQLTATAAAANRVVAACVALLTGPHDRSRLPAVQVLQALAASSMQVPRLAVALAPILSLLSEAGGPGWAGGRQLACGACTVLAALLAPSECEAAHQQQARRVTCLSGGGVHSLLALLGGGAGEAVMLPAAACLRYLALAPGAADVMAGDPAVARQLLGLLSSSVSAHPGVCAYVAGLLWELAASSAAAEQLLAAGTVSVLLQVVRDTAAAVGSGGGKKKRPKSSKGGSQKAASGGSAKQQAGKADSSSSSGKGNAKGKDGKGAAPAAGEGADAPAFVLLQDPQAAAQVALCNATGALHHLSFLDAAKAQVGASSRLELLVRLAGQTQGQTYDNLVGLLWNVGLLDINQPLLAAAGAPPHLARPIPARWTTAAAAAAGRPASAAAGGLAASAGVRSAAGAAAAGTGTAAGGCVRQTTLRFVG